MSLSDKTLGKTFLARVLAGVWPPARCMFWKKYSLI